MSSASVNRAAQIVGIVPQLLVGDLDRAVAYYRDRLGFELEFVYDSFYASVSRNGFAIHLKHADTPAPGRGDDNEHEHLDAYIAVTGIRSLFEELRERGADVIRPLAEQPWRCIDFYVEDPDGHLLCFSEAMTAGNS